jgi:hypothetical protein
MKWAPTEAAHLGASMTGIVRTIFKISSITVVTWMLAAISVSAVGMFLLIGEGNGWFKLADYISKN